MTLARTQRKRLSILWKQHERAKSLYIYRFKRFEEEALRLGISFREAYRIIKAEEEDEDEKH